MQNFSFLALKLKEEFEVKDAQTNMHKNSAILRINRCNINLSVLLQLLISLSSVLLSIEKPQ